MKKYRVLDESNIFSASAEEIREYLEVSFGEKFGFLPMKVKESIYCFKKREARETSTFPSTPCM